jgi:hypothetical protein
LFYQNVIRKTNEKDKIQETNYSSDETYPIGHHLSPRGSTPLESSLIDVSSSGSAEATPRTASMSIDTSSTTKTIRNHKECMHTPSQCPLNFSNQRPFPPRTSYFGRQQYHGAWETLSRHYHPNQHEYNKVISSLTQGKKQKRKNIFQLGRSNKSISSSRKNLGGLGSSGSSSENTPISNAYQSVLLSSANANIRKEPRPSSVHGHLGGSGHHHGVSKIRRSTESGTESGGSSGSSTRDYQGGGRGRTDNEEVITALFKI